MFDRLEDTVNRYEDITAELGNPDVVNDQEKFRKLMKEQSSLAPLIETYTEYKNCKKNIEDSLAILDEETDEELKEMAKEELNESKARVEELEHELKILLLPKDPNDDKDIVVEIRAGAGGEEAALFAAELFRMYVHYAQARGWLWSMILHSYERTAAFFLFQSSKTCLYPITLYSCRIPSSSSMRNLIGIISPCLVN